MSMRYRYGELAKDATWGKSTDEQFLHALMGLVAETGEFVDLIKKERFYPSPLRPTPETYYAKLREELGDVLFYLSVVNEIIFGGSLNDVKVANLAKLCARYPDKFPEHLQFEDVHL